MRPAGARRGAPSSVSGAPQCSANGQHHATLPPGRGGELRAHPRAAPMRPRHSFGLSRIIFRASASSRPQNWGNSRRIRVYFRDRSGKIGQNGLNRRGAMARGRPHVGFASTPREWPRRGRALCAMEVDGGSEARRSGVRSGISVTFPDQVHSQGWLPSGADGRPNAGGVAGSSFAPRTDVHSYPPGTPPTPVFKRTGAGSVRVVGSVTVRSLKLGASRRACCTARAWAASDHRLSVSQS